MGAPFHACVYRDKKPVVSRVASNMDAPSSEPDSNTSTPEYQEEEFFSDDWAKELLEYQGIKDPKNLQLKPGTGIAGALSRVLGVTITYENDGENHELSVVVKLPPRDPFARLFVAEAQFNTREILFYKMVAPDLERIAKEAFGDNTTLPIPKFVRAKLPEDVGADSELVLEDACVEGYKSTNFAEGLNVEKARAALRVAARLHALSLALQEREGPLEKKYDFLFPKSRAVAGYLRLARRGLPQLEVFLRQRSDCVEEANAVAGLASRASELLDSLIHPPDTEPTPLAHADFWSGNLLFRERDGEYECLALDWQMVSLGRPMDDVALLILSSLNSEIRRAHTEELLEEYGARLEEDCAAAGAGDAGRAARASLREDWRRAGLRALLLCAGSVEVALGCAAAETRLLDAVRDLHAEGALQIQPNINN